MWLERHSVKLPEGMMTYNKWQYNKWLTLRITSYQYINIILWAYYVRGVQRTFLYVYCYYFQLLRLLEYEKIKLARPRFELGSKAPKASMLGHYTQRIINSLPGCRTIFLWNTWFIKIRIYQQFLAICSLGLPFGSVYVELYFSA